MHPYVVLAILLVLSPSLARDAPTKPRVDRRVHPIFNPAAKPSPIATSNQTQSSAVRRGYTPRGINYWGGRVLVRGVNVYLVWYGTWTPLSQSIIRGFIGRLGETPTRSGATVGGWWNINSRYFDNSAYVNSKNIKIVKELTDNYSLGKNLGANGVRTIATRLVTTGNVPNDPLSLILILTSTDVTEGVAGSQFCNNYCGWHYYYSGGGYLFQYGFVGNPATKCPQSCIASAVINSPPNGDKGADGMVSVIAHELTETVTDPNLNAWFDSNGYENADKCAWAFGTGLNYNLVANSGARYLIQANWDPLNGYCTLSV